MPVYPSGVTCSFLSGRESSWKAPQDSPVSSRLSATCPRPAGQGKWDCRALGYPWVGTFASANVWVLAPLDYPQCCLKSLLHCFGIRQVREHAVAARSTISRVVTQKGRLSRCYSGPQSCGTQTVWNRYQTEVRGLQLPRLSCTFESCQESRG